jgi:hypothetical protein
MAALVGLLVLEMVTLPIVEAAAGDAAVEAARTNTLPSILTDEGSEGRWKL